MRTTHPNALSIAVLATALLAACAPSREAPEPAPPPVPLAHDPTDEVELAAWWRGGGWMLHLEPDGRYELFDEPNPYREPAEVGRWSQASYAAMWLEPYRQLGGARTRVSIDRLADGRLALRLPRGRELTPIQGPPEVLEDRLVGAWTSESGRLLLRADGQYWYEPGGNGERVVSGAGHTGRWTVADDETLQLQPSAGVAPSTTLRIERDDEDASDDRSPARPRLRGPDATYSHDAAQPAGGGANG